MRRRWGRDGVQHSFLASVGGFLIVPAAAGVLSGLFAKAVGSGPQATATIYAGGHLAGLSLSWYGAKKYPEARSFLRGGMWGEGFVSALAVTGAASMIGSSPPAQAPAAKTTVSGEASKARLQTLASELVRSGFVRR